MSIEKKQDLLLKSLLLYYGKDANLKQLLNVVCNKKGISLRIIDYLCTNYAKTFDVVYYIDKHTPFNLYLQYRAQLKAYSKMQFDPFRRHNRIIISVPVAYCESGKLETTVAQLNFFKWAIDNNVMKYLENPDVLKKVEAHMNKNTKSSDKKAAIKSDRVYASAKRHNINVTVTFK